MDGETQRAIAVWAVLVGPFALLGGFLFSWNEFSAGFVLAYWFPVAACTFLGVIPRPWEAVPG
jgi:hypothetical protein